jgi:hypothetical protein
MREKERKKKAIIIILTFAGRLFQLSFVHCNNKVIIQGLQVNKSVVFVMQT